MERIERVEGAKMVVFYLSFIYLPVPLTIAQSNYVSLYPTIPTIHLSYPCCSVHFGAVPE